MAWETIVETVTVSDGLLADPDQYRADALARPVITVPDSDQSFRGIAVLDVTIDPVSRLIADRWPTLRPHLTFLRKSPQGQIEPNFIHTDDGMGEWTGILYLNPVSADGDGTDFWRFRETGEIAGSSWRAHSHDLPRWERWRHLTASFNRLILFDARLFHSRAIYDNYGNGDEARLIQVVHGTWTEPLSGDSWKEV